jgi:hypothetical protein
VLRGALRHGRTLKRTFPNGDRKLPEFSFPLFPFLSILFFFLARRLSQFVSGRTKASRAHARALPLGTQVTR